MKLRLKTWLIVGTALLGLPVIFVGAASVVLLRGFSRLEEQIMSQNVQRVLEALDNDLDILDRLAIDWGHWDDTYTFALDRNPAYLTANYPEGGDTPLYLRLNLMMILDASGQILFAQRVDLDTREVVSVSDDFLAQLRPYMPHLSHSQLDSRLSGIVPMREGPLLVASRPILTSSYEGPSRGAMVLGRFLNNSEVERLEQLTNLADIAVEWFATPHPSEDIQAVRRRLEQDPHSRVIQPRDKTTILGYASLQDITGQPLLLVQVAQDRNVYAQGQTSLRYLVLATVTTAVIFSVITLVLLERSVLSRLKRLSQQVNHTGAAHDLSIRVSLAGRDELSDLAETINWAWDQLAQSQQALQQKSEALAASNAELEQFAYVASHDLQEPLRKIEAFGVALQEDYAQQLDEAGQSYLSRMQNAAGRMRRLIQDLLELSRVTTQTQTFSRVNLTEVVQSVIADLEPQIQQLGAQIEVNGLPTLEADPTQMRQLFQNLIGNGLTFHRSDAAPVVMVTSKEWDNADIAHQGGSVEEMYQISVADNGIGFDEQYRERIFQMFQRLHTRDEFPGTGIGLAICAKIVKHHGGRISASSQLGQGSAFTIFLPRK